MTKNASDPSRIVSSSNYLISRFFKRSDLRCTRSVDHQNHLMWTMLPALRSDGMATNSSATLCRRLQCRIKRGVEESLHKNYNAFCTSISGIRLLLIRFAPENHNFLLYLNRNLPRNLIWKLYYITLIQCRYRRCFHFTFVYKLIMKFFGYRII